MSAQVVRSSVKAGSALGVVVATLAVLLALTTGGTAGAASTPVTVAMTIPSAATLTNSCSSTAATSLGTVLPGAGSTTATGAGVCRVTFGSSNDTSMLRISQADGTGDAMGMGIQPPVVQRRDNAPGRMNSVFAADDQLAFTAGNAGVIRRTMNGGTTTAEWTNGGTWNDVEMIPGDPDTWWFVGNGSSIRQSVNARATTPTFTSKAPALAAAGWPAAVAINGITIPNASTIVLVGDQRWIAVSTNAGTSWTAFRHANASVGNLMSVDALDANSMVAVDDTGRVLTTTTGADASAKWTVAAVATEAFLHVAMPSASRVYAVGVNGTVWTKLGATWTNRSATVGSYGDATGVTSAAAFPDRLFVSSEHGGIYESNDAGVTWSFASSGASNRLGGIHTANGVDVFAVGGARQTATSHDAGATFSVVAPSVGAEVEAIAHSPSNGQAAIEVGANGEARATSNGGTTWTAGTNPSSSSLFGVGMASDQLGWAVGDAGTIVATSDGGATWSAQTSNTTNRLLAVTVLNRNSIVAVGQGGDIRTSGGGGVWSTRTSGTSQTLTAVSGSTSGSQVIAVGTAASILRSSDLGQTWSTVATGTLPDPAAILVGVQMVSDTTAYAATLRGRIWKSTDAGATWTALPGVTGISGRKLSVVGKTIVVVGLLDQVAVSTDGGTTFTTASAATGLHLQAVDVVDTHTAYVGGQDASIERLDVTTPVNGTVSNWASGSHDWTHGGFFGVCLQALTGVGATADWTVDDHATVGLCEQDDDDRWQGLPAASTKVAHLTSPGSATAEFVWGFRPTSNQLSGTYEATAVFEVVAPDA